MFVKRHCVIIIILMISIFLSGCSESEEVKRVRINKTYLKNVADLTCYSSYRSELYIDMVEEIYILPNGNITTRADDASGTIGELEMLMNMAGVVREYTLVQIVSGTKAIYKYSANNLYYPLSINDYKLIIGKGKKSPSEVNFDDNSLKKENIYKCM